MKILTKYSMNLRKNILFCQKIMAKMSILSLTALLLQSCLYISVKNNTEFDKNVVSPIKFESRQASNLFYLKTKIHNLSKYKGAYAKRDSFMIPFIAYKNHTTFYKTEYINSRIKEADYNADGIITLKEAKSLKYEKGASLSSS